jgi:hypothetical protein
MGVRDLRIWRLGDAVFANFGKICLNVTILFASKTASAIVEVCQKWAAEGAGIGTRKASVNLRKES